ncbi:hypothetical protein JHK84_055289 [Glycine max]|uniref:Retrotransposon Copia-like N-terminal domain-containing protein n=2 Tax=Glycine subgen. Soja TaxID=1462606 RepID=A0A0R0E7V0_SOYBN|nr:hypothetical protein JHK85_056248 [Glycine max]KAG5074058.1 hypothetical protein JHK84_055289 [Glycine max]RZB42529.1 hypothetical protein D0Y65_053200 [Glycine soja]
MAAQPFPTMSEFPKATQPFPITTEFPMMTPVFATPFQSIPTPTEAIPATATSSSLQPYSFSHVISAKLTNSNYSLWCQQVQPVLKGHRLHHFLVNPTIPSCFRTLADRNLGISSPELLECHTSWHLWDRLHSHFRSLIQAKTCQLRTELCSIQLQNKSISEYLLQIQTIVNSLGSIGVTISPDEQLDVILEGLPKDYESTLICSKFETLSINEVATLLLGHEARLNRFQKLDSQISDNLIQGASTSSAVNFSQGASTSNSTAYVQPIFSSRGGRNYGGRSNASRGDGHGRGRFANVQCQVCHKFGHEASFCYHRYEENYVATQPMAYENTQITSSVQQPSTQQAVTQKLPSAQEYTPIMAPFPYYYPQMPYVHNAGVQATLPPQANNCYCWFSSFKQLVSRFWCLPSCH